MSQPAPNPVLWVIRRRRRLFALSLLIMIAAPYLGSLPVRTIPAVVALAAHDDAPAAPITRSAELDALLGDHADDLGWVLGLLIAAGAVSFLLALANTRVAARLSSVATSDLRLALHETLMARPPGYLRDGARANMARTALVQQARVVAAYATNTVPAAFGVFFAVIIWAQTLRAAIHVPGRGATAMVVVGAVVGVLVTVNLVAVWLAGRNTQASQRVVMAEQAAFMGLAGESIGNHDALRRHVAAAAQTRRLGAVLDRMAAAEVRVATWSGLAAAASGGVVLLGIPLLVVAWRLLGLDGARLAVMIPALLMLQRSIAGVGSLWTSRKMSLPAVELCAEILSSEDDGLGGDESGLGGGDRSSDSDGRDDGAKHSTEGRLADQSPLSDSRTALACDRISLHGVRWSAAGRPVLRGVDLEVGPGDVVALVGAGGSGKSTLLSLILAELRPDAGVVRVGGRSIAAWATTPGLDALRRRVGILDQHPAFFDRSVRENLLLDDREMSDDAIAHAARAAQAHDVIAALAGGAGDFAAGLGHRLGAGTTLSGSERRRLALTRLFLRDPDILLLDELEAGLPQAMAQALYREIRARPRRGPCLMVTHRPELAAPDRVAFVHDGCIVDLGTHGELHARSAAYRQLLATREEEQHE